MRSVVQIYPGAPSLLGSVTRGSRFNGALAQMGERLICIQEVRSSILLGSTKTRYRDKFRASFGLARIFDIVEEGSADLRLD